MIVWEEVIKEWSGAREFRIETDQTQKSTRDCAVQTEREEETSDKVCDLVKDFPNLKTGEGLLPDPDLPKVERKGVRPLEWMVVVYPHNQSGGRKVIHLSPSYNVLSLEVDWARHPCCGTMCTVRSTPLREMTDCEPFGPAPM